MAEKTPLEQEENRKEYERKLAALSARKRANEITQDTYDALHKKLVQEHYPEA